MHHFIMYMQDTKIAESLLPLWKQQGNPVCVKGGGVRPGAKKSHRSLGLLVASGDLRLFADSTVSRQQDEEILMRAQISRGCAERRGPGRGARLPADFSIVG